MKTKTVQTELVCTVCGNRQTIHRRESKQRPLNHIKHLYCYVCKERVKFCEIGHNIVTELEKKSE